MSNNANPTRFAFRLEFTTVCGLQLDLTQFHTDLASAKAHAVKHFLGGPNTLDGVRQMTRSECDDRCIPYSVTAD